VAEVSSGWGARARLRVVTPALFGGVGSGALVMRFSHATSLPDAWSCGWLRRCSILCAHLRRVWRVQREHAGAGAQAVRAGLVSWMPHMAQYTCCQFFENASSPDHPTPSRQDLTARPVAIVHKQADAELSNDGLREVASPRARLSLCYSMATMSTRVRFNFCMGNRIEKIT